MNYLQKNKRQGQRSRMNQIILIVVLVAILFIFGSRVKGLVQIVDVPVNAVKNIIIKPFGTFFNYLKSKDSLSEQNAMLDETNKKLRIELLTIESLRKENEALKSALQYSPDRDDRSLAKVLNKPPFSPYDTFVIDLGNSSATVDAQIYYQNVPIGKILETYAKTSVVKLYSSSGEKIVVNIGSNSEEVEAVGVSNGGFIIQIPKDILVEVGQTVTLSTGQVVGIIEAIEQESSNTFQKIYFNYPFDLKDIDWVEVSLGEL